MGLTIAGISFDAYLAKGTLRHLNSLNSEPDTLDFVLIARAPKPAVGSEVIYTLPDGTRLFGGVLASFPETPVGFRAMGYACTCVDWRPRADRRLVNDRFVNQTAGAIIKAVFAKYAPEFNTSLVDVTGSLIASIRFKDGARLTAVLDRLAELTGWVWDIDPLKRVLWAPMGTQSAPMELNDTSRNFEGLDVSINRDELRNVVIVKGGKYPRATSTTDRYTGDGMTTGFRLTQTPYGTDEYVVLSEDFPSLDLGRWVETDVSNPAPPAGHIPSDGYLFTTIQQGAALAESGSLQAVGGNSIWGASRLQSFPVYARGDGGRRFEFDVYPNAKTYGLFGLWDPANLGATAGAVYAFLFNADGVTGVIQPYENGFIRTALATVNFAVTTGAQYRLRIVPKAAGGAVYWVNSDFANGFRASQWVKLYDSAYSTLANLTVTPIFNFNFNGRIDRIRVFNALNGVKLATATHLDGFDANTAANYSQLADTVATWTFNTAASRVEAGGGAQSLLHVNGFSAADVTVEAVARQMPDGGIAFRIQDNANYYLLAIRDGIGSHLEFYKRVANTYTSLAIANVAFTAGTPIKVRLEAQGSTLRAYYNDTLVINITDTTFAAAGKVSMRHGGGGTSIFDEFSVNKVDRVVGLLNVDEGSGVDALIGASTADLPVLAFFGDTTPANGAAIVLTYYDGVPVKVRASDAASIAAVAALEGHDGIYEHEIVDLTLDTQALARQRGTQDLAQYANPITTLSYKTRVGGLRAGQVVSTNLTTALTGRDLTGSYLIQQVETRSLGLGNFEYSVTASSKLKGLGDYLADLLRAGRRADTPDDDNAPLDEFVFAEDTLTLSDSGTVAGPGITTADTITFTDLGSVADGPVGPFVYGPWPFSEDFEGFALDTSPVWFATQGANPWLVKSYLGSKRLRVPASEPGIIWAVFNNLFPLVRTVSWTSVDSGGLDSPPHPGVIVAWQDANNYDAVYTRASLDQIVWYKVRAGVAATIIIYDGPAAFANDQVNTFSVAINNDGNNVVTFNGTALASGAGWLTGTSRIGVWGAESGLTLGFIDNIAVTTSPGGNQAQYGLSSYSA